MVGDGDRHARIVGRESALAVLERFLQTSGEPSVHVLTGPPGIGKTALWESALAGMGSAATTLRARASEAEAQLSFAGLTDLLAGIDPRLLAALPAPQQYAIEVALHRRTPDAGPPEDLAVSLGFLAALTLLADRRPVVVAIDDVQWLDRATADVLAFAIRRLLDTPLPVRFLLAQRSGTDARLLRATTADRRAELPIEPLSVGAVRSILFERLGLTLTRRTLHRLCETARGNPLFALELGRAIIERGTGDEELALPVNVEELVGTRISRLPDEQQHVLVAVAICSALHPAELEAAVGSDVVEAAVAAGLITVERDTVRVDHPLLAAAALASATHSRRREVSGTLAAVVTNEQLHARLLAGAATEPSETVAATIAAAAEGAERRGAFDDAVELTGHAFRLTPAESDARPRRLLLYGRLLAVSGRPAEAIELLTSQLETLPSGRMRAEALIGLASEVTDPVEVRAFLERARSECPEDAGMRAAATAVLALRVAVIELRDVAGSEARLVAELPHAAATGPELAEEFAINLLWINALRGYSVDEAFVRFPELRRDATVPLQEMIDAQRLIWRGEIAKAREQMARLIARSELGTRFYALNRLYLCELELRCGHWDAAERLLAEWAESSDDEFVWPMYERCQAHLAAGRGNAVETERWVAETLARAAITDEGWNRLAATHARGLGALAAGVTDAAITSLREVWEHTQSEGIDEPGVFPAAPDLVEALCDARGLGEARLVAKRLAELAERFEHPWARLATRRAHELIRLAEGDAEATGLATLAADYAAAGLEFDSARCLLAAGRAERRRRRWASARDLLERAVTAFDELGSAGWAEQARSELSRVGARKPSPKGDLTPTEARTAALAAQGLANKEIAAALHVTVHTVEVHLSRTYAKLGVRSRGQLAAHLRPPET